MAKRQMKLLPYEQVFKEVRYLPVGIAFFIDAYSCQSNQLLQSVNGGLWTSAASGRRLRMVTLPTQEHIHKPVTTYI